MLQSHGIWDNILILLLPFVARPWGFFFLLSAVNRTNSGGHLQKASRLERYARWLAQGGWQDSKDSDL